MHNIFKYIYIYTYIYIYIKYYILCIFYKYIHFMLPRISGGEVDIPTGPADPIVRPSPPYCLYKHYFGSLATARWAQRCSEHAARQFLPIPFLTSHSGLRSNTDWQCPKSRRASVVLIIEWHNKAFEGLAVSEISQTN